MRTILFRADSSSIIGTGHIMRDLVLAKQFQDANIIFAVQELSGNINHKVKEAGYQVEIVQSNALEELLPLIEKYDVSMIVLDHYDLDYVFEKRLKEKTGVKLFVLDDTYEKHHCDILLNQNIYADVNKYRGLVPDSCELRCGERYTLLRDEFIEAKQFKKELKGTGTKTIFIAMGGSDIANLNSKILRVLEKFDNLKVDMVTTIANQNLKALEQFVEDKPWVNLHINSTMIAKLMGQSDLAIVTPSVTMNEVWYMEIPFIAIEVASNQTYMSQFLTVKHKDILKIFDEQQLYDLILSYLEYGCTRINFTDLTTEEKKRVLQWRNHDTVRRWMYNKELIALKDHMQFIDTLKRRDDRVYFLVKNKDKEVGVIDLTSINLTQESAEIGLYAKPGTKGAGKVLIESILDYGFKHLMLKTLYSNVYIGNIGAIKLYEKFGFIEKKRDEELIYMELKNENR